MDLRRLAVGDLLAADQVRVGAAGDRELVRQPLQRQRRAESRAAAAAGSAGWSGPRSRRPSSRSAAGRRFRSWRSGRRSGARPAAAADPRRRAARRPAVDRDHDHARGLVTGRQVAVQERLQVAHRARQVARLLDLQRQLAGRDAVGAEPTMISRSQPDSCPARSAAWSRTRHPCGDQVMHGAGGETSCESGRPGPGRLRSARCSRPCDTSCDRRRRRQHPVGAWVDAARSAPR